MRKLLNKPWVVAVLAVAALAFVGQSLLPKRTPVGTGESGSVYEETTSQEEDGAITGAPGAKNSIQAALKDLPLSATPRDPFAPSSRPGPVSAAVEKTPEPDQVETLKLSAIWVQGGATYLLINDKIVQAGDRIGRVTVDSATIEGVWLKHWKGRDFLSIGGAFTLATPARQAATQAYTHDS
jgi:hypothetical protein